MGGEWDQGVREREATRQLKLRRGFRMMDPRICTRVKAGLMGKGRGFKWWLVVRLTQLHVDMSWTMRTSAEEQQAKGWRGLVTPLQVWRQGCLSSQRRKTGSNKEEPQELGD